VNAGRSSTARAASTSPEPSLLCRIGDRLLAVPLVNVVETMRPLPVESFPGTSRFVLGVSTVRGAVVPVLDVGGLTGGHAGSPGRFVTIGFDGRTVVLAVDAVIGVQSLHGAGLHDLPPLLDSVDGEMFAAIGTLDAELLVVLDTALLVPDSLWASLTGSNQTESEESDSNEQVTAS
jgi:purine-binding chemotaxis protein CheW